MNPPEAINLEISFPSLFLALDQLKEDPYEAGRLLGLVSNVAYVLITPHVLCADVDSHLACVRGHATQYLTMSTAFYEVWPFIDLDELANFVRIIYDFYVLTSPPIRSPSSSADTMSTEQQEMVDDIERRFCDTVYNTAAENLYNGDHHCIEMLVLQWGCNDGKSLLSSAAYSVLTNTTARDYKGDNLNNTTASQSYIASAQEMGIIHTEIATTFHPSPTHYEPDSTGVEYTPIGPHVPLNEFSTPCQDLCAPEDQCGICYELLVGLEDRALVCARCQARHPFHEECLNEWVNGSAMPNANTCPLDREFLCEGRGKIHMVPQP